MLIEPYLINEVKIDWITFARVGKWFLFTFTKAPCMGLTNVGLDIFGLIDFGSMSFHQQIKLFNGISNLEIQ